jgi:hypothetical protein
MRRSAALPAQEFLPVQSCGLVRNEGGEMRLGLIARVREQIAAGDYDTPEKWEVALERLQQRLGLA